LHLLLHLLLLLLLRLRRLLLPPLGMRHALHL
jgi:hypothetical protein